MTLETTNVDFVLNKTNDYTNIIQFNSYLKATYVHVDCAADSFLLKTNFTGNNYICINNEIKSVNGLISPSDHISYLLTNNNLNSISISLYKEDETKYYDPTLTISGVLRFY